MKIFRLCSKYLLQKKLHFILYIALTVFTTVIGILSPYITGEFLDVLIMGSKLDAIFDFCVLFGVLNLLKILLGYITSTLYIKMQISMGNDFNCDMIRHVQKLPLAFIKQNDCAYLNQKINNDCNELMIFCLTILQNIIINSIMLIVPFSILLNMNRTITIIFVVFILVYIILYFILKNPLYKAGFELREYQSKYFSSLFEQILYIKLIKINSVLTEINKRLDKTFTNVMTSAIKKQKINYLFSGLDNFISVVAQIALFVIGGALILSKSFSVGMFTIFSSYFGMMMNASRYFFNLGATYQNTLAAYDRVVALLNEKEEKFGSKDISDIKEIVLSDMNFSYNNTTVIKNFSTSFKKGTIYGITGANGAGKSTLIDLIIGLHLNETCEQIMYDNIPIDEIDMISTRKQFIAFAEQESLLINDSLLYNLVFTNDSEYLIDREKLSMCARILNIEHFVLNGGIDFVINESSSNMSGGEKQKIALLRALYKDAPLMIFDEPTAALDSDTAKKFMQYLQQIKFQKIIIIVTHDTYVKEKCDLLLQI